MLYRKKEQNTEMMKDYVAMYSSEHNILQKDTFLISEVLLFWCSIVLNNQMVNTKDRKLCKCQLNVILILFYCKFWYRPLKQFATLSMKKLP